MTEKAQGFQFNRPSGIGGVESRLGRLERKDAKLAAKVFEAPLDRTDPEVANSIDKRLVKSVIDSGKTPEIFVKEGEERDPVDIAYEGLFIEPKEDQLLTREAIVALQAQHPGEAITIFTDGSRIGVEGSIPREEIWGVLRPNDALMALGVSADQQANAPQNTALVSV